MSPIATQLSEAVEAHRAGDFLRARMLYDEILAHDPRQPDALHMLGLLAQRSGDLRHARALIEASIAVRSDVGAVYFNLGIVCALQGDVAGAIRAYESAIANAPNAADAHVNLANLYHQTGRRAEALRAYSEAIRQQPDHAAAYANLGTVLIFLERYEEAIKALEMALRLAPEVATTQANLAQAYRRAGRFTQAVATSQRALELRPDRDTYVNLALAATEIDLFEVALEANAGALALGAPAAQAYCNAAQVHHLAGRHVAAIAAAEAAIAADPAFPDAHINLALSLLLRGDFQLGWAEYEWMWRVPARRAAYPYFERVPLWRGEPFPGKTLVVTRDQGYGDAIQMVRYLPAVKARGGRIVLETSPALLPLFATLAGVDELRVAGSAGSDANSVAGDTDGADLHIPLLGLPGAFGTDLHSIPAPIPYLQPPLERVGRWRERLGATQNLRVGIIWAGDPGHQNDRRRSARLDDFATLGAIAGVSWFGLQKGHAEHSRSCGLLELDPLGPEIVDFGDSAAIVALLDLVIAVDTSIVHLAGAMGKPVWTLLAFTPDWRWLLERNDSPWYPTMRLFRQPRPGDWGAVFQAVANDLRTLVERHRVTHGDPRFV